MDLRKKFKAPVESEEKCTKGNNGTLQSGAVYSNDVPTGPAYHSLLVNGTSAYVQVPTSSSLNVTGSITVETWIKVNSIGAYQDIISRESYGQSGTGGGYGLTVTNLGQLGARVPRSANLSRISCAGKIQTSLMAMFNPQPLHFRPLESRANLFAD